MHLIPSGESPKPMGHFSSQLLSETFSIDHQSTAVTSRFPFKLPMPESRPPPSANPIAQALSLPSNDEPSSTTPRCCEIPHLFSSLEFIDALTSLADAPEAQHSKHPDEIRPCQREGAHATPHYVCLSCRNQAMRHIFTTNLHLIQLKCLPLCIKCGDKALQSLGKPPVQGTPDRTRTWIYAGKGLGCRCAHGWLCWQCREETYEIASARRDAEIEFRKGLVGPIYPGSKPDWKPYAFIGAKCRCGHKVEEEARIFRCAGCEGVVVKPT